ncbi:hypothetical protein [Catenuloplanes atrovinosus]|uniref:Uncharacterized protein n=1 Tax=Catenuloplanes atrovinosus TaxID=137266 RepID=A0AAE4C7C8_9ACTN|nr:hypothetical protein [Catenuloplanes atrovinosus]MDR7273733.1 hypothetical protein [Catenuloplanes atrovinosus]
MKITMANAGRISLMVATAAFGVAVAAAPAAANWGSTGVNKADIAIVGGDAKAVGACFNVAKTYAKLKKTPPKIQSCSNISSAQGGGVVLKDVDITVIQDSSGARGKKLNDADIKIAGGDATGYAACANVLSGSASSQNYQDCAAISEAKGGDVKLTKVDLTVIQTS